MGVLWNRRTGGDLLLRLIRRELSQRFGSRDILFDAKPFLGNAAESAIIDRLADNCDAVIVGVGASCTSASVIDAISLERRGVPAAMVGSEILVDTVGRGMATAHGYEDFPMATIADVGYVPGFNDIDPAGMDSVVGQIHRILTGDQRRSGA
jgi:hypothetical protein